MKTIERSKIAKELEAFCDKYDTYSAAALEGESDD
jgi:hypothetical protein